MNRLLRTSVAVGGALALLIGLATPALAHSNGPNEHKGHKPPAAAPTPAVPNAQCTLVIPADQFTAVGLATPYRLRATNAAMGPCNEANVNQSAFVEAAVLDKDTGQVSLYRPLVIDEGTAPAIPPVVPTLPANSVVSIWFGFQGDVLTLRGGRGCVNGAPDSPFGQFGYCGAIRWFAEANAAIRQGKLVVPPLGMARDGLACPSTRDFSVVDQDQSDNLDTTYLTLANGQTAQFSNQNAATLGAATVLTNASDNGLLNRKIQPALGCTPMTAPDLTQGGAPTPALALNELQAAAGQKDPIALIPVNDPMAQINAMTSIAKTDLYRLGTDQPLLRPRKETGALYCTNLAAVQVNRLALDQPLLAALVSPDAAFPTLHAFLVNRLAQSWTNLGCPMLTGRATPNDPAPVMAFPVPEPAIPALAEIQGRWSEWW